MEQDLWILSCNPPQKIWWFTFFFFSFLCAQHHTLSFCSMCSRKNCWDRVLNLSFKGRVLLKHEILFSGGDSPSCARPGWAASIDFICRLGHLILGRIGLSLWLPSRWEPGWHLSDRVNNKRVPTRTPSSHRWHHPSISMAACQILTNMTDLFALSLD